MPTPSVFKRTPAPAVLDAEQIAETKRTGILYREAAQPNNAIAVPVDGELRSKMGDLGHGGKPAPTPMRAPFRNLKGS